MNLSNSNDLDSDGCSERTPRQPDCQSLNQQDCRHDEEAHHQQETLAEKFARAVALDTTVATEFELASQTNTISAALIKRYGVFSESYVRTNLAPLPPRPFPSMHHHTPAINVSVIRREVLEAAISLVDPHRALIMVNCGDALTPGGEWTQDQTKWTLDTEKWTKDWTTEEGDLFRRSTIDVTIDPSHYPIPALGVIFHPQVMVFRHSAHLTFPGQPRPAQHFQSPPTSGTNRKRLMISPLKLRQSMFPSATREDEVKLNGKGKRKPTAVEATQKEELEYRSARYHLRDLNNIEQLPYFAVMTIAPLQCGGVRFDDQAGFIYADATLKDLMAMKIKHLLRAIAQEGHRRIVIGALGCGVGEDAHPATVISQMFASALEEEWAGRGWWQKVVFAIPRHMNDGAAGGGSVYEVFLERLDGMVV